MAVIHKATISPTKTELLESRLGAPVTVLGTYRFDDPADEVGVEAFILGVAGATRHVVLAYRGAPLEDDRDLITTMEHSALGRRWIYDGLFDPVALDCFARALRGELQQAVEEVWDGAVRVATREPTAQVTLVPGEEPRADGVPVIATELPSDRLTDAPAGPRLRATWDGGTAVVAALR